jgi:hypothetical protein
MGCTKNSTDSAPGGATKFPVPDWAADDTGKYPATMTAVFALPAALGGDAGTNDKLAAFVNETCRGLGVLVEVNNVKLYFVLIQGLPDETNKVAIRYYNSKTSYLYESQAALTFSADGTFGTAENPQMLALTQLR